MRDDHARIAQIAGAFFRGRILVFDHLAHGAVIIGDNPAISERISRAEAEHSNLRCLIQRIAQIADGFRLHHRTIAETDHHQPVKTGQRILRHQRGMSRAQLRFLQRHRHVAVGHRIAQLFVPVSGDHDGQFRLQLLETVEQMEQHRLAANRVEDLVQVRFHAGALARGKDYGCEFRHAAPMPPNACRLKNVRPRSGA